MKLATPLVSPDWAQPVRAPGPPEVGVNGVIDRVTVEALVVTGLPEASSTVTWGWVAKAEPATDLVGLVVNTRRVGGGVT